MTHEERIAVFRQWLIDTAGAEHEEDCPADDTCDCEASVINGILNAIAAGSIRTEYRVRWKPKRASTMYPSTEQTFLAGTAEIALKDAQPSEFHEYCVAESRQVIEGPWLPLSSLPQETPER